MHDNVVPSKDRESSDFAISSNLPSLNAVRNSEEEPTPTASSCCIAPSILSSDHPGRADFMSKESLLFGGVRDGESSLSSSRSSSSATSASCLRSWAVRSRASSSAIFLHFSASLRICSHASASRAAASAWARVAASSSALAFARSSSVGSCEGSTSSPSLAELISRRDSGSICFGTPVGTGIDASSPFVELADGPNGVGAPVGSDGDAFEGRGLDTAGGTGFGAGVSNTLENAPGSDNLEAFAPGLAAGTTETPSLRRRSSRRDRFRCSSRCCWMYPLNFKRVSGMKAFWPCFRSFLLMISVSPSANILSRSATCFTPQRLSFCSAASTACFFQSNLTARINPESVISSSSSSRTISLDSSS
mmetsp:Transcript_54718/g.119967  ORF Transcript_54718/g.119967 Transcript_54718/m.119967 type:complete len:363 (-) Transcript_54718:752-1840(-)